jgi:hypothetical protein
MDNCLGLSSFALTPKPDPQPVKLSLSDGEIKGM